MKHLAIGLSAATTFLLFVYTIGMGAHGGFYMPQAGGDLAFVIGVAWLIGAVAVFISSHER